MMRGFFFVAAIFSLIALSSGARAQEDIPAWKKALMGVAGQAGSMQKDSAPSPAPPAKAPEEKEEAPPAGDGIFRLDPGKFGKAPAALPDGGPRPLDTLDAAGKAVAEEKNKPATETPAAVQDPAPVPPETPPPADAPEEKGASLYDTLFPTLTPDLQKEILNEAQSVYDECQAKASYAAYHDCSCIGTAFVEERLRQGLDVSRSVVMGAIDTQCVNEPGIAGKNYDDCYSRMTLMSAEVRKLRTSELDGFCKCLARTMAKRYAAAPNPNYKYISRLRSTVTTECYKARDRIRQTVQQ